MKIHKDLLTHDGTSITQNSSGDGLCGKLIDLGFNGDFDHKKSDWNMLFVQCDGGDGQSNDSLTVTMKVYTALTASGASNAAKAKSLIGAANLIASVQLPADVVKNGGVIGLKMPDGLKRYFTINFVTSNHSVGSTAPKLVAGITDEVDTDLRLDWTFYKAATGTTALRQRSENVGAAIAGSGNDAL